MKTMKGWYSPFQFAIFRILLGLYLTLHFAQLVPYAGELFSQAGMLPDATLNPTSAIFPNLLRLFPSAQAAEIFVALLSFASLLFAAGVARRGVALVLWYGWACLWNRNPLISNPGLPYVGWLLLACVIIPSGEPMMAGGQKKDDWELPPLLYWGAWALLAVGYTVSGIHKLTALSWRDGSAIIHVLEIPLARFSRA